MLAPTRKWLARTVIAISGLLVDWQTAEGGHWGQAQTIMAITVATGAIVSYLLPNDSSNAGTDGPLPGEG